MKGFFITLDGPEGSGKSTQARRLVWSLRRKGYPVVFVRDPGSTALGRRLRRRLLHTTAHLSPMAEALLFIGGRVALVEEKIMPALKQGKVVICDRFHDATVVYQGFAGGVSISWLDRLARQAIRGCMPQLTLFFDLPVEQGFRRLRRSHDRMESKTRAFHEKVRRGYLALSRKHRRRIQLIDASKVPAVVSAQIEKIVLQRLLKKAK